MLAISICEIPKKEQHSHAHKLLRECLKPLDIAYSEDSKITLGEYGKPSLAEFPDVFYNISHAEGIAACIVTDRECGIDCEQVREFHPNVMKRAFTEKEREMVLSAPLDKRDLLFFRLWTLKESYIKATGKGLSQSLQSAEFEFDGELIFPNIRDFKFKQFILKNGKYIVSICTKADK